MLLECMYKNEFLFTIDTDKKKIKWDNREGDLQQFINGTTGGISSMAGVTDYDEFLKGYSYITPHIYKNDITDCNDWEELEMLYKTLV